MYTSYLYLYSFAQKGVKHSDVLISSDVPIHAQHFSPLIWVIL
jgi:hypothetical protein